MEGYKATITNCNKELTPIEKVKMKDFQDAVQLDDVVKEDSQFYLQPVTWANVSVHNEHSKNEKDYEKMIIVAADGEKYVTGSKSFMSAFDDIAADMVDDNGEYIPFAIKVYKRPSKNYSGSFITCSITDVITE